MPENRLALSRIPPTLPEEAEYDAICDALRATARGRWFLEEYASRLRQADIAKVLAATERLESAASARAAEEEDPHAAPPVPQQGVAAAAGRLRAMAIRLRACGIGLETSEQIEQLAETLRSATALHDPTDHRAQKLSEVLQYLEFRMDQMLDSHAQAAREEAVEAPGAAAPEEKPAEEAAVAALDEEWIPDEPTTLVDAFPISETPSGTAADTVVEIVQPASDETTSASPDVSTTIEPIAVAEDPPAPSFVELDFATFARRIEPVAIVPDPEWPAASVVDEISEPSPVESLAPAELPVQTEPEPAQLRAPDLTETAPPEAVRNAVVEPAVPDPSLLQADVNDDVVIVDIEMLLPIELADKRAVVKPAAEPPVETDNTVEVAVTVGDVAATGDAVATQVDQDLDALGTVFTPKAAGEQPPTVAKNDEPSRDHEGVADTSQTAASKAESVLDTALAAGREHVPSMWEPSILAQASHDDPADFLLEPLPAGTPSAPPQAVAAAAAAAATPAVAGPPPATGPTTRHATGGPLAALAAMSDEERIALFT